jgi:hypothetical protein
MKRLVLAVIVLMAIFAVIRAYTEEAPSAASRAGIGLSPGLIEVSGGTGTLGIAYGLLDTRSGGAWNILPMRIVYTDGPTSVSLGLNGFSFLLGGGVRVGKPVRVDAPHPGDLISMAGPVTIASRVEGDVWAFGADVTLLPGAEVTGSVVAVGGKVKADPKARVRGTVNALPRLKLPFLGVLATAASGPTVELVREILGFLLGALILFIGAFFVTPSLAGLSRSASGRWRQALLLAALSLAVVPLLVLLLAVTVFGVFILPFLAIGLIGAAFTGYFSVLVRLGAGMRRASGDSVLFLFTSGVLGLFVIKAPGIAGIILALVRSGVAGTVGQALRTLSLAATLGLLLYGLGTALAHLRGIASGKPAR